MEPFQQPQEADHKMTLLYHHIFSAAKVAGLAAVISITGTLAGAVAAFLKPTPVIQAKEGFSTDDPTQQLLQTATYISALISVAIGAATFYFLYRFSTLSKTAVKTADAAKLNTALYSLSRYFKIWGGIMFLIIVLFILSRLGGIAGGAAAGG